MLPFTPCPEPTLGIEQEYHLIDPASADLTPSVDAVLAALPARFPAQTSHEVFLAVLETGSPVAADVDALVAHVREERENLAAACAAAGCLPVAAGSHPFADWSRLRFVDSEHYQWVRQTHGYLVQRLLAFGLHIHVGIRSAEAALYVMHEMKRWAWALQAFAANSPYFEGRDTGLATVRSHIFGAMPRTGLPPDFTSWQELVTHYEDLRGAGDITRPGCLWWNIRPQPPLGTVEYRLFDLAFDIERIGTLAAVVQAATVHYQAQFEAGVPRTVFAHGVLEQNRWKAQRYDLDAIVLDAAGEPPRTQREHLQALLETARPFAGALGSSRWLDRFAQQLQEPTQTEQQRAVVREHNGDLTALERWLATATRAGNAP